MKEWFKVGESESESAKQHDEGINRAAKIQRGIYRDKDGALYELVAAPRSAEDLEPLVVYRELFGKYQFWVATPQAFFPVEGSEESCFSLVKQL